MSIYILCKCIQLLKIIFFTLNKKSFEINLLLLQINQNESIYILIILRTNV